MKRSNCQRSMTWFLIIQTSHEGRTALFTPCSWMWSGTLWKKHSYVPRTLERPPEGHMIWICSSKVLKGWKKIKKNKKKHQKHVLKKHSKNQEIPLKIRIFNTYFYGFLWVFYGFLRLVHLRGHIVRINTGLNTDIYGLYGQIRFCVFWFLQKTKK